MEWYGRSVLAWDVSVTQDDGFCDGCWAGAAKARSEGYTAKSWTDASQHREDYRGRSGVDQL